MRKKLKHISTSSRAQIKTALSTAFASPRSRAGKILKFKHYTTDAPV